MIEPMSTQPIASGRASGPRLTVEQALDLRKVWQRRIAADWDGGRRHVFEVARRFGVDVGEAMRGIAWGLLQDPESGVKLDDLVRTGFHKPRPKPQQEA